MTGPDIIQASVYLQGLIERKVPRFITPINAQAVAKSPAAPGRQSRSNQVSGGSLPKTRIFAELGEDFGRFGRPKPPNGKVETDVKSAKARQ